MSLTRFSFLHLTNSIETWVRFRFHNYASGNVLVYTFPQLDKLGEDFGFTNRRQKLPIEECWKELSSCDKRFASLRWVIERRQKASRALEQRTLSK